MGTQNMPREHRAVITEGAAPRSGCNNEHNAYTVLGLLKDKKKIEQE